jgi:hypothetical protein
MSGLTLVLLSADLSALLLAALMSELMWRC